MLLVVGITGATGVIYGIRLLEVVSNMKEVNTHLIISRFGERVIEHETDYKVSTVKGLADCCYDIDNMEAPISSGSFQRDAMVIAPCSMKTLSALANSYSDNLLARAGDVNLKERKPLVLLVRETPLHQGHIRNMLRLAEMGAIIMPPIPSFYHRPKTINDIINHTIARILDHLGIDHNLSRRWAGI